MDLRELDRRAVLATGDLVAQIRADQLELPTPCADWTLRQLLVHLITQHHGFAAAARGAGPDLDRWQDRPLGDDPVAAYAAAAADVIDAFAAGGVLEQRLWLPELSTVRAFPAPMAIGFHLVDYIAHAWDVAATIGAPAGLADDLVEAGMPLADQVPDTPPVRGPDGPFRPRVEVPADAPPLDRYLAILGRDPNWSPVSA